MGRYLDIANKFEARMRAEGKWPLQGEQELSSVLAQKNPPYHTLYWEMTLSIPENSHLVDGWFADHHPGVWQKIRDIDNELARLEEEQADEGTYRAKLEDLLTLCRAAKNLREGSWGAVLIRSAVLEEEEVWLVQDEEEVQAVRGDGRTIYYRDEIDLLKSKTPEEIRNIHKAKLVFPGSRVMQ